MILLMGFSLVSACSRTVREEQITRAPAPTAPVATTRSTAVTPVPPGVVAVVPDHPLIRTSGVVENFDPATGLLTFRDGRVVRLTDQSTVTLPAESPRRLEPGQSVVVQNVLPVGVRTSAVGVESRRYQHMGTVANVDRTGVQLTDGNTLRMAPATKVHMGTGGSSVVLEDLRPGDEIVFVVSDPGTPDAEVTEVMIFRPVTQ
jgi:hypothetical protein